MITELLPEEKRRLHELELQLIELEKGNPNVQSSDVYIGLNEMNARLLQLETLAAQESRARREDCRRRVQHLRNSHQHIKNSLDIFSKRRSRSHEAMRKELFGDADLEGGSGNLAVEIAEHESLSRSGNMVNEYLSIGQQTLHDLMEQKDRLKSVQRKVFDILNYLGISNSIMRAVEQRDSVDRWIVVGGIAIVSLLIFCIWYYRR